LPPPCRTSRISQELIREERCRQLPRHPLARVKKTPSTFSSKIQSIDPKVFLEYLEFRRNKKTDILATVVANESVTIKQMHRYAAAEGLIHGTYLPLSV